MWTSVLKYIGGGLSIGAVISLYTLLDQWAKPTESQQKRMNSVADNVANIIQKMENHQNDRQAQYDAAMGGNEWQEIQTLSRQLEDIPNAGFGKFEETFRSAFQNYVQTPACNYSEIQRGLQSCVDYASRGAARWLGIARPGSCTIENAQKLRKDCGLLQ